MIVLPLMIDNVTVNVSINFKDVSIKNNQLNSGAKGVKDSDVIIGKTNLSSLETNKYTISNPRELTNVIRKNMNYSTVPVDYIEVNTKKYTDSDFYDTYIIPTPQYKPNEINDYIYGMLVNSIRFSNPENIRIEKLSLNELGFNELFNIDFLNKIQNFRNSNSNSLYMRNKLMSSGYEKQLEVLDFFNTLDCKIEDNDVILTSELDNVIDFFSKTKKENKVLTAYKNMALNNYESYMSLAALNTLVNGKVLDWPTLSEEQQKILIRKLNSERRAA